jgi:putative hemolysin
MTWTSLALIVLIVCSGIVSGAETALFGLRRQDVYALANARSRFRRLAAELLERPKQLLLTLLITNTAVNVGIFAVSFVTAQGVSHHHPLLASAIGLATLLAVILFGEIVPKSLALAHAPRIAPAVAPLIHAARFALGPVRWFLSTVLVVPVTRMLQPGSLPDTSVSTDELRQLVEASAQEEVFSSTENEMLQAVVSLADVNVRAVMVPRVDVVALSIEDSADTVRRRFAASRRTKLPVYCRHLDDVRGLLYARDFYLRPEAPIVKLLRPVDFIPEQATLIQVIRNFRSRHTQLAIVVDEYGGMAGLVTLEDVLEEIVGDLPGSDRPSRPLAEAIDANTYRVSGRLGVRRWASLFGLSSSDTSVDTLGGLVTARLGRLPRPGDLVRAGQLTLTVARMERRRVEELILRHESPADGQPDPEGRS